MTMTEQRFTAFTDEQATNLRWWSNRVRALQGAQRVDSRSFESEQKLVEVTLYRGRASDGWKTDFERVERWWVEVAIGDGIRRFVRGKRFSKRAAAQRFYAAVS